MRAAFWVVVLAFFAVWASTGGPDDYGYTFRDSEEPGVAFEWISPSPADTPLAFLPGDDDEALVVHLPFTFSFYGIDYDSIWVSTNGLLSFYPDEVTEFFNEPIPDASTPNGLILPLWDDQKYYDVDTIETAIYAVSGGEEPERWFAVIWYNFFRLGFIEDVWTYEAILYESSSGDGAIVFQYLDATLEGEPSYSHGASATIGIENEDGTVGLQYSYNEASLSDSLRIEFLPPAPVDHNIAVVSAIAPFGRVVNIEVITPACAVRNFGSFDEAHVPVVLTITGDASGLVYADTQYVDIASGTADTVLFSPWTDFPADSYSAVFVTSCYGDEVPSDDTLTVRFEGLHHVGFGGPDVAGYMWYDNYYDGAEAPEFEEIITSDATELDLAGDDEYTALPLPFSFPFYETSFDTVWVSTNGFLAFEPLTSSHAWNDSLPTTTIAGVIAPFWDDLKVNDMASPASKIYTKTDISDGTQRFLVIFSNVYVPYSSTTDRITFEVILAEDGGIVLQYTGLVGVEDIGRVRGNSATVGISSPDGTSGLIYEYNGAPPENPVIDELAIRFVPPSEFVDTFPPQIAHEPESLVYLCASEGFVLWLFAQINAADLAAETLYYECGGEASFATAETTLGTTYGYLLSELAEGETLSYYFVAWDTAGNRSVLPEGAPAMRFTSAIGDPHHGANDALALIFADNFADAGDAPFVPTFAWVELDPHQGGSGTPNHSVTDYFISETKPLGPPITFIGEEIAEPWVRICSNGFVTFDTTCDYAYTNGSIPDSSLPNLLFAALWTDLTPEPPEDTLPAGRIFYGYSAAPFETPCGDSFFVVEWKDFYAYFDPSGKPATFQLWIPIVEAGASPCILTGQVVYLSVPDAAREVATIGVENAYGEGLAYVSYGNPAACLPVDSGAVAFIDTSTTKVCETLPRRTSVGMPYPNPFNSVTEVDLYLAEPTAVSARVTDLAGRVVATIAGGKVLPAGRYTLRWSAKNASSGIYLLVVDVGGRRFVRKTLLVR